MAALPLLLGSTQTSVAPSPSFLNGHPGGNASGSCFPVSMRLGTRSNSWPYWRLPANATTAGPYPLSAAKAEASTVNDDEDEGNHDWV